MHVGRLTVLVAFTALYFVAGRLGLSLAVLNESTSPIWPPTGLAIAGCVLVGRWIWPAVLAGAFLVNLATSQAVFPSALIAGGNTAEALIVASLVRRFSADGGLFATTSAILAYVAAATLGTAVAASVGVVALIARGLAQPALAPAIWLTWWAGDLSSAVLLTSVILTLAGARGRRWTVRAALEACLLLVIVVIAAYLVFGPSPFGVRNYPLMFLTLPVLLWAALRFGLAGAAVAVFATAAVATVGTLQGLGPFARGGPNESLLLLQAYLDVKMIVMLTLASEVAARRRIEQEIRLLNADLERRIEARSEELLRLHGHLVEAQHVAHIGSWEWDMRANAIWWSDEMYRVYGLDVGVPVSYERFISLVHPDDRARVQGVVSASARTGEPFAFEHRAVKPDGSVITLHSRGRVVTDEQGLAIRMLGIGHDITERKHAEEERLQLAREQAARREAEEANRMKDYFLATLSHELRTPINALLGWTEVLKKSAFDEAFRDKAIDAIQRNVTIQGQLVSDILDVAHLRSGAITIESRPIAIRSVVDGALEMMRPVIAEKTIQIVTDIAGDAVVVGDARRLQQVCWNILSNAAKFLPPRGTIVVTARPDGDAVQLTIEDDGPGMPEEFLPYAFEPFRQADSSATRLHGGLGLGLAITRNLVQLHGGTITAGNRPEGGAIFTIRLPAALPVGPAA